MYSAAGVSGPSAFGALPRPDRIFWRAWMAELIQRSNEAGRNFEEIV